MRAVLAAATLAAALSAHAQTTAQARAELIRLDNLYQRAIERNDLPLYRTTHADTHTLSARLGKQVGGPASAHPLRACWQAAIALSTWRGQQWIAAHSRTDPVEARIVQSHRDDFQTSLRQCK